MLIGGVLFLAAAAVNIAMLIIGRMILGFSLGFTLQAAPVYLSETAPARWRGAFTSAYNAFVVVGILSTTVTNYFTNRIPGWGWRVSLGLAAVPGAAIVLGAIFVSDTPHQPGHARPARHGSGRAAARPRGRRRRRRRVQGHRPRRGRGAPERRRRVPAAVQQGVPALPGDRGGHTTRVLRVHRHDRYLHLLAGAVPDGWVQQPEGYPWLRDKQHDQFGVDVAVLRRHGPHWTQISVRRWWPRHDALRVAISWIMADHLGKHGGVTMPRSCATGVLVLICMCTFSFGLSWAPLRWVVPSEIYPVEVRSAGQALSISFVELQVFIALLCAMKYAVFLFYATWLLAMTVFVVMFLPETKGVPLEAMLSVWARHWYRRRFVKDARQDNQDNCL